MGAVLTRAEREAIAAFPRHQVQVIPRGVSGFAAGEATSVREQINAQHRGRRRNLRRVFALGREWPSVGACASDLHVSRGVIQRAIDDGTIDAVVAGLMAGLSPRQIRKPRVGVRPNAVAVTIDGRAWPSLAALAAEVGLSDTTITLWHRIGALERRIRPLLEARRGA